MLKTIEKSVEFEFGKSFKNDRSNSTSIRIIAVHVVEANEI